MAEALNDERHQVLRWVPPRRVRLMLMVGVRRRCSAGFPCTAAEFGQVRRVRISEANIDVQYAAPARRLRNAEIELGLGDWGLLSGRGIRPRRQPVVPSRHVLFHGNGHASVPAFQGAFEPVKSRVVEFEDNAADFITPGMIASQIKRRPAELTCSRPVRRAESVFPVRGWRRLRVELIARVIAAKASTQRGAKVDIAQS